jgi:hypothetical protein
MKENVGIVSFEHWKANVVSTVEDILETGVDMDAVEQLKPYTKGYMTAPTCLIDDGLVNALSVKVNNVDEFIEYIETNKLELYLYYVVQIHFGDGETMYYIRFYEQQLDYLILSQECMEQLDKLEQYIYDNPNSLFSELYPKPSQWMCIDRVFFGNGMLHIIYETYSDTTDSFDLCIETYMKQNNFRELK